MSAIFPVLFRDITSKQFFNILPQITTDFCCGDSVELDHHIPAQADHPFRAKLTSAFRGKLTTPNT